MGSWPACLLVKLLVKGTIFILAFYYIGYTLSGQIILHSEIIIIWPLSVCVCVCVCVCVRIRGLVHEFVHGWGPASLARGRGQGQWAGLPAGQTPGSGDNLHIRLLLYRIYTEWPDYYAFRDHNNLATQYNVQVESMGFGVKLI